MRAPDTDEFHYIDKQWKGILKVLAGVGVDGDRATIITIRVRKRKKLRVGRKLKDELERWRTWYDKHKDYKPPAAHINAVVKEELAAIEAFRQRYKPDTLARMLGNRLHSIPDNADMNPWAAYGAARGIVDVMLEAIGVVEAELKQQLTSARKKQLTSARKYSASKLVRDDYWLALVRIWAHLVAPHPGQLKRLADFLVACTGASASAVRNFLDRRHKKQQAALYADRKS